jgi:methyl-accepting chemotaxis protein
LNRLERDYVVSTIGLGAAISSLFGLAFCWLLGLSDIRLIVSGSAAYLVGGGLITVFAVRRNLRNCIRPIGVMTDFLESISQGVLNRSLAEHDFNMLEQVKETLVHMGGQINLLMTNIMDCAADIEQLGASTAVLEENSKSAEEQIRETMSMGVSLTEENQKQKEIIRNIILQMAEIQEILARTEAESRQLFDLLQVTEAGSYTGNDTLDEVEKVVRELQHESQTMLKALGLIEETVRFTNLLGLNASIEASRVGKLGFMTVATEIRNLAEQSLVSAEQIKGLITGMHENIAAVEAELKKTRQYLLNRDIQQNYEVINATWQALTSISSRIQMIIDYTRTAGEQADSIANSLHEVERHADRTLTGMNRIVKSLEQQLSLVRTIQSLSFGHLVSGIKNTMARYVLAEKTEIGVCEWRGRDLMEIGKTYRHKTVVFAVVMAAVVFGPLTALAAGQRTMEGILVGVLWGGLAGGVIAWVLASMNVKRIIEPAVVLIDHAQAIAAGDLNRELTGSLGNLSQLGSRFNDMVNQISQTVNEISNIADSVKNTARRTIDTADRAMETWDEIAGEAHVLTGSARAQTMGLEIVSQEIAGIAEAIQGVAREADLMHHEMQKTVNITQEGLANAVLQKSKARETSLSVERVSEVVARLQEDSDRISEVVRVIADIASQTSLLAFNAAIESGRAALSGRAFGVLAEETRILSQEAASATQEIGGTVPRVQEIIGRVVSGMQQVQVDLGNQVRIIGESEEALARIENQAQLVRDQSLQIMKTVRSLVELQESVVMDSRKVAAFSEENVAGAEEIFTVIEDQTQTYHMIKEIDEQFLSNSERLSSQIMSVRA